jgi:allantoicase
MIKKEFNYLGKNVKLEAYNNGGLQVVNQFLQDYIFNPFENMVNGKELSFLHDLFNNGNDCMDVRTLDVYKARKYTYVLITLGYGNFLLGYDNFSNQIRLKFEK